MMTDDDLKRWRELADAATKPPWRPYQYDYCGPYSIWHDKGGGLGEYAGNTKADAEFIAAARTAVPALLNEVERLRAENAEHRNTNRNLHRRVQQAESKQLADIVRPLQERVNEHAKSRAFAKEWLEKHGIDWMFNISEAQRQAYMEALEQRDEAISLLRGLIDQEGIGRLLAEQDARELLAKLERG